MIGDMLRARTGPERRLVARDWHGTPPLTSRPGRVAAERLFVIGDASGYVEPFSGEGMATALETALAVAPLADRSSARSGSPSLVDRWECDRSASWSSIAGHLPATGLDSPPCRGPRPLAIALCRAQPWVARRFIAKVS